MNFFEHQAQARKQSRWLLAAFAGSLLLVALFIAVVVALALGPEHPSSRPYAETLAAALPAMLVTVVVVMAVMLLASLYKTASLRQGGAVVARSLGATQVEPGTTNPAYRRLRNVVEEMAIAASLPVPDIFVLEAEDGINAFAAGFTPSDAAVAVTRGALNKLKRDELQGVIAHEFSHILNGDMRINLRMMGLLFGLFVLSFIGARILQYGPRGDSKKDGAGFMLLGLALVVAGWAGLFFGRLIKAQLSQRREYLADASAVQFTRQTLGIAGALKKALGLHAGTKLASSEREAVSHMLFGDGVGLSGAWATHPPLPARIKRLEPSFDDSKLRRDAVHWNDAGYVANDEEPAAIISGFSAAPAPGLERSLSVQAVIAQVAHPGEDDYRYAALLHEAMPEDLRFAALLPDTALTLLLALLLGADEASLRSQQLARVGKVLGSQVAAATGAQLDRMAMLHPAQRLPLAMIAFPALRQRPAAEIRTLATLLQQLVEADGRISAFEFAFARMLRVQLADVLNPAAAQLNGTLRLPQAEDECLLLLAVLAQAGAREPDAARRAYMAGAALINARARAYAPPANCALTLDAALARLDQLLPNAKQLLIEAMVKTMAFDGRVTVGEAELLRVVCASLHCPLPPALGV